jgi:hypothetical protein
MHRMLTGFGLGAIGAEPPADCGFSRTRLRPIAGQKRAGSTARTTGESTSRDAVVSIGADSRGGVLRTSTAEAVEHRNHTIGAGGDPVVVADDEERQAALAAQSLEQVEDLASRPRVQAARRLIREQKSARWRAPSRSRSAAARHPARATSAAVRIARAEKYGGPLDPVRR